MSAADQLLSLLGAAPAVPCPPGRRHMLVMPEWAEMVSLLGAAPEIALRGLWADPVQVFVLLGPPDGAPLLASVGVENGFYPALSATRPEAAPFERMVRDLWGHGAAGAADPRLLLDHGRWPVTVPLAARHGGAADPGDAEWLPPPPDADRLIRRGPVHGGLSTCAELVLAVKDGGIRSAERRGGHAHRGVLALMRGKSPRVAARFAARAAGDATVAHGIAFALAAEAACGVQAPDSARKLRGVMASLERAAIALADLGRLAEAGGAALLAGACAARQAMALAAAGTAFGHRLMMDTAVPGGVAAGIAPEGAAAVLGLAERLAGDVAYLATLSRETLAPRLEAVAAARPVPDRLLAVVAREAAALPGLLEGLEGGPLTVPLPVVSGEGIGFADGPHGQVWHWMRLEGGQIAAAFLCDPGWSNWADCLAALPGCMTEDAALLLAAFGCSSAGVDL